MFLELPPLSEGLEERHISCNVETRKGFNVLWNSSRIVQMLGWFVKVWRMMLEGDEEGAGAQVHECSNYGHS